MDVFRPPRNGFNKEKLFSLSETGDVIHKDKCLNSFATGKGQLFANSIVVEIR